MYPFGHSNDRQDRPLDNFKTCIIKNQAMSSADEIFVGITRDKPKVSSNYRVI
jgi:hypothetical protein